MPSLVRKNVGPRKISERSSPLVMDSLDKLLPDLIFEISHVAPVLDGVPVVHQALVMGWDIFPDVLIHEILESHVIGRFCIFVF